jgi:anti-sigma regulatory factor (Ser/Thr protein kinase)
MRSASCLGYRHDALYFASPEELVTAVGPFLRSAVDAGEAAVLICRAETNRLVLDALDHDPRVTVLPAEEVHTHATRALAAYGRLVADELSRGASRVRVVGEAVLDDDDVEAWREWLRFEALANRVLDGLPLWTTCVYDRRRVPVEALVAAGVTHPHLAEGGVRRPNPLYQDPAEVLLSRGDDGPDPLEAGVPALDVPAATGLQPLRHAVRAACADVLGADTVDDFVLAVGEVVGNAVRHGQPPVRVRVWTAPGRAVCAVTDQGHGVTDPFAGYRPVHGEGPLHAGMGLWLARQLCHRVHLSRGPEGFTVRLTAC